MLGIFSAGKLAVLGIVGAGILGAWFYVGHLKDRSEDAEKAAIVAMEQRKNALDIADSNAERAREIAAQKDREISALSKDRKLAVERATRAERIKFEIENAPQEDDGPVALVLGRTGEWLRDNKTTTGRDNQNRDNQD